MFVYTINNMFGQTIVSKINRRQRNSQKCPKSGGSHVKKLDFSSSVV